MQNEIQFLLKLTVLFSSCFNRNSELEDEISPRSHRSSIKNSAAIRN
jgi:hypothetical protein